MNLRHLLNDSFLFRLIRIIKALGGTYTSNINSEVFCILVKKVGSPKHNLAKNLKIPLVEIQWLLDCRLKNEKLELEKYMVKCFLGLVMTSCVTVCALLLLKLSNK
jgi:hypothetical protein